MENFTISKCMLGQFPVKFKNIMYPFQIASWANFGTDIGAHFQPKSTLLNCHPEVVAALQDLEVVPRGPVPPLGVLDQLQRLRLSLFLRPQPTVSLVELLFEPPDRRPRAALGLLHVVQLLGGGDSILSLNIPHRDVRGQNIHLH